MSKLPSIQDVKPLLPLTFKEISRHFPEASPRGLRDLLNSWVRQGQLFTYTENDGKPGKPSNVYTAEKPDIHQVAKRLTQLQYDLKYAICTRDKDRLVSVYKRLGNILLNENIDWYEH